MSNETQKPYVRYTQLFNKVCSGPIFLALVALVSVYTVVSAIYFFGTIGNPFGMLFGAINLILSVISTIAFWLIFAGAKKGNIKPSLFKLATLFAKFVKYIANAVTYSVTFASIVVVALVFALKDTLKDLITGIYDMFGPNLPDDLSEDLADFCVDAIKFIDEKSFLLAISCIVVSALLILSTIRFYKVVGFMKSVFETYTKGHMVAAPTMFFPVLSFIVAAFALYVGFIYYAFDLMAIVYGLIIAVGGVLILLNKNELADIYAQWQLEQGMVSADAAAAAAPAAPATEETPAE